MANEAEESPNTNPNSALINSFCEITSSSQQEAIFYLESHNYDLDAAVLTFFDSNQASNLVPNPSPNPTPNPNLSPNSPDSPSQSESLSQSQSYSPSRSNSRSRSVSPPARQSRAPYELRSRRAEGKKPDKGSGSRTRGIRTLADLNQTASDDSDSDPDEPQEYYTGGEKSGMLVQDPTKGNDVDSIFNQAKRSGAVERPSEKSPASSKSKSFTGKARLLSGEAVSTAPQPRETVTHTITFWQNGFTVDDGPLRRLDDPQNASFLESIKNSNCPEELEPADRRTAVHIDLVRRDETYTEPKRPQVAFKGTGRTLGSTSSAAASEPAAAAAAATAAASSSSSVTSQPLPFMGLIVDDSLPTTSIQLRLADGTRMVSRFNYSHTIRDIRSFIDASRPGGARNYLLQTMGFPPKQLSDDDQTIEQAGIGNSVVIQKF